MEIKQEINEIVEKLVEEVLEDILDYLKELERTSRDKMNLSFNLNKILKEDTEVLKKLAQKT